MQEEMKNCRKYAPKMIKYRGLAGGAAFSIRQDWTDTRENDGREGEVAQRRKKERGRRRSGNPPTPRAHKEERKPACNALEIDGEGGAHAP